MLSSSKHWVGFFSSLLGRVLTNKLGPNMDMWLKLAETVAHVTAVVALVWSILVFAAERRAQTEAREFEAFTRLLDLYERVAERRQNRWRTIKDTLRRDPKTAGEAHDRQDSLSYLELRASQAEPLFAAEHGLLEDEIQSLNLLNELCRSALEHERCRRILAVAAADEISYYQNKLPVMRRLYERERGQRLFSRPQSAAIEQVDIGSRFDPVPSQAPNKTLKTEAGSEALGGMGGAASPRRG